MSTIILHLGGDPQRVAATIDAYDLFERHIIIGSERDPENVARALAERGIGPALVSFDYHAFDTLTNFTALAERLKGAHVIVVSSAGHLNPRAARLGRAVGRRHGFTVAQWPRRDRYGPESRWRILVDAVRGWVYERFGVVLVNPFTVGRRVAYVAALRAEAVKALRPLGYRVTP